MGYVEAGPADGPAVLLLHGWPYDIHSYEEVDSAADRRRAPDDRPHLRGYGARDSRGGDVRNGEQAALALDAVALMDALGIEKAVVAGFDWGARSADIVAALWPERSRPRLGQRLPGRQPGSRQASVASCSRVAVVVPVLLRHRAWPLQATTSTAASSRSSIWRTASPKWDFDDATFDRSAASFDNPDHVAIVIHNYRWRLGLADGEAGYAELEQRLAEAPAIAVPTITLEGDANGAPHLEPARLRDQVLGPLHAPHDRRRNRPQPPAGSAGRVRRRRRRRRLSVTWS